MPGSPEISTTHPSAAFACSQRRISSAVSSSPPTSGVAVVRSAAKRLSTELARSAAKVRTGPAMPLRRFAPRSSSSNRLPSSFRVLPYRSFGLRVVSTDAVRGWWCCDAA
jgi:hypothetical protein